MKPILLAAAIILLGGTAALGAQARRVPARHNHLAREKTCRSADYSDSRVAVFPLLLADMDTDGTGAISTLEQHAYVVRILRDLSLKIDGQPLKPQLLSTEFPAIEEMKEGRGEIRIEFEANLPSADRTGN